MALAQRYPGNALLQLRGQPGSHDLQLARQTFAGLMTGQPTAIPAYDKSLHSGLGDRRPRSEWTVVEDSLDILLFEGWSLGFKALSMDRLRSIYSQSPLLQRHSLDHLVTINQFLSQYEDDVYPAIDIFLHLTPTDLDYVYQWRLQQEHHMKATRDVSGLSDEAVRAFVDTYMPAYVMYLGHLEKYGFFGAPDSALLRSYEGWQRHDGHYDNNQFARHLRFRLDKHRQVVATTPIFPTKRSSSVPDSRAPAYPWLRPSLLAVTTCAIGLISWSLYHHQRRQVQ
ncbi:hypothetical protein DM01DRAFT_1333930 [Hesseltinella vesiculosa]|uniref:Uncharacterized protein n=1 Tax=Hesseltinella vesiculosa TaxID=101127 RepID=A0A1X2GPD0_9FUNG|nr:hypothetical protein DM01DRAFT_1333930 [Hesseltinella vesiculosa]